MKVCLIGDYSSKRDESQRVTAFHLADNLSKIHQVQRLHIWDFNTVAFWKKLRAFQPDIIHYVPGMSLKSLVLMKIISLYCRHAKTVISAMRPYFSYLSARLIPLLRPDLILTQSYKTEKKLKSLGLRTRFLSGGVDTGRFMPLSPESKKRLRERYGIDNQNLIALHVGSIKPGRGVKLLAELQKKEAVQMVVVGPTSVGIHQDTMRQLEESGCLVWTGYFENIEEIYALADCYVYPTIALQDRFGRDIADSAEMPLSVLEAMSCNLPVIATRFGALPRVFSEGNGFLFAEPEEFANCLEKVRGNKTKVKTREMVLPYSWDNIVRNLEDIYVGLVKRGIKTKRSLFICFTGMDGAGKTTLARATLAELEKAGISARYVHSRLKPFISKPAMLAGLALFLRGKEKHKSYSEYATRKKRLFKNRILAGIYRYFLSVDYFLQIFFKIRMPLLMGKNIVCDRYIYDTVILDLAVDLNYSPDKTSRIIRSWLRFLPKPDLVFLVDAPAEIVFARKDDIPSLDYLMAIRSIFLEAGKDGNMVILDSSRPVEEVEENAIDRIREFLALGSGDKVMAEQGNGR